MWSPLEQFEIVVLKSFSFFGVLDLSVTNSTIFLFFISFGILFFGVMSFGTSRLIPSNYQLIFEQFYQFIFNMLIQQTGKQGAAHFPIFFLTFFFILYSNFLGLFPFGFTVTGHLVITFALAFSFNLSFFFLGFIEHGLSFLKLFKPSGAPKFLLPLIVVIEVLSYSLRSLSLSIRLFANMMAGHTLMFILSSFVIGFIKNVSGLFSLFPVFFSIVVLLAVVFLEVGIAFLQAYVFVILLCIYLNDALHPGH